MRKEQGLRLLQYAWNEYDVAKYHGHWYSIFSNALMLSYLALGVFIVIFIVILTESCGDEIVNGSNSSNSSGSSESSSGSSDNSSISSSSSSDNGGNCLLPGLSKPAIERTIFSLTLVVTLIVSLDQWIKPARKAMHLKPAAEKLKSWIWLYR